MENEVTPVDWVVDGSLSLVLPVLAFRVLVTHDLRKAVVLFTAIGLLSALAWARLAAPDVALVEAAVGAGLTGALLMSALGWVRSERSAQVSAPARAVLAALLCAVGAGIVFAVFKLPPESTGLTAEVSAQMPRSGVGHPVTAVLLNFRGYDTLLEIAVLLAAAAGVAVTQGRVSAVGKQGAGNDQKSLLLLVLARLLTPGIILVAGYLLWRGSDAPGGAFQAGAILGGGAILLLLARIIRPEALTGPLATVALLMGPAVFVAVAVGPLFLGLELLEYPPAWAGALILTIEAALTLSIAVVLTAFFAGVARLGDVAGMGPEDRP